MSGVDHLLPRPYIDSTRLAAAGGSYGGYMVNWMLGKTKRFRAFVSHAGVYDLRSFFGSTEELWFPLWEFLGPPWETPEAYDRGTPSANVENFSTPTLVVHGELDYRVPVSQGMQLFTALQMRDASMPPERSWAVFSARRSSACPPVVGRRKYRWSRATRLSGWSTSGGMR